MSLGISGALQYSLCNYQIYKFVFSTLPDLQILFSILGMKWKELAVCQNSLFTRLYTAILQSFEKL